MEKTKNLAKSVKTLKTIKEGQEEKFDRTEKSRKFAKNSPETTEKTGTKFGKTSQNQVNQIKADDSRSPEKEKTRKNVNKFKETFPKNINEFRHIIDTFKVNFKDLEWVLELRSHKPSDIYSPGEKATIVPHPPNFSGDIDYNYVRKEYFDTSFRGVSTDVEHLMRRRLGEQANKSQLEFETTLRDSNEKRYVAGKWMVPKKLPKDHIESFLPPVTKAARRNMEKMENYLSRPIDVAINKINTGIQKSYELNKRTTLACQWDHKDMEPYNWKYHNPNVNSIQHVLGQTSNNSISKWTVNLRDSYNAHKTMTISDIKSQRNLIKELKKHH